ncbi:MAG: DUF4178 domain-containing protein, partial [Pseudomonadota bacterium]
MTGTARALNCASCGAGQSLPPVGRMRAHACLFCGAILDAADDFTPIAAAVAQEGPETPFAIGQSGRIRGVEMLVIGVLGMEERHEGKVWRWVDAQLFSPTHGFAWLTWEEGRVLFTRKQRVAPWPPRFSARDVARAENRPSIEFKGQRYSYFDSGFERIAYAAGSFNFAPDRDAKTHSARFLGPEGMFAYRDGGDEVEWELTEALDRDETLRSFGVSPETVTTPAPGVHALEPFQRSPLLAELRNVALAFAPVALILGLMAPLLFARTVAETSWAPVDAPISAAFEVTDANRLLELEVSANVTNAWAVFELELRDLDAGRQVTELAPVVEYYQGYQDGRWSEGARQTARYVRPPRPGRYLAVATFVEGNTWRGSGSRGRQEATRARLTVREGVGSG